MNAFVCNYGKLLRASDDIDNRSKLAEGIKNEQQTD